MSVKTASKSKQVAPEQEQNVADVVVEVRGAKRKKLLDSLERARKFAEIKAEGEKGLEAEKKILRELGGDATVLTINGVPVLTNRWRFETKVDKETLKTRYSQVWNAVTSVAKTRYLDRNPGSTIKS